MNLDSQTRSAFEFSARSSDHQPGLSDPGRSRKQNFALKHAGLTLNNALLIVDKIIFPLIDFSTWRLLAALSGMAVLLYGLIWDTE